MLSILMLAFVIIATAIPTNAGCAQGNTACTGVCVPFYGPDGQISSYSCSGGETAAPKDCTTSDGGGDVESL